MQGRGGVIVVQGRGGVIVVQGRGHSHAGEASRGGEGS